MSTLEERHPSDRPSSLFEATKTPSPAYPPLRLASGTDAPAAQGAIPAKPAAATDLQQALGHWTTDGAAGAAAKDAPQPAAPPGPKLEKGDEARAGIESVQVVTRTDSDLSLRPSLSFEKIPWNSQDKRLAYDGMQTAAAELRRAEAAFKAASDPKAKEKALQQFEAATQRAEAATHKLRNYVRSQLPGIERHDPQMQQYKRWEAQTRAAESKSKMQRARRAPRLAGGISGRPEDAPY